MGERLKEPQRKATDGDATLLTWAKVVTVFWLCAVAAFVFVSWDKVSKLDPNAVGDFLAGAFAPMAFGWLVVAVFLQRAELQAQRHELEQNREALLLQAHELRNSVEQLTQQTEIFSQSHAADQRKSKEENIGALIDQLSEYCHDNFNLIGFEVHVPNSSQITRRSVFQRERTILALKEKHDRKDWNGILSDTHQHLSKLERDLDGQQSDTNRLARTDCLHLMDAAIFQLNEISALCDELSNGPAVRRFEYSRGRQLMELLVSLQKKNRCWTKHKFTSSYF